MNNPASTILHFASCVDDLSFITPLSTLRPSSACTHLADPPAALPSPTTLHTLISAITHSLATTQLPLDPTLPLLQAPRSTPLKPFRPRSPPTPLLPSPPTDPRNPLPAFLSAQAEHLHRVSHYNFTIVELSRTASRTHQAAAFCDDVIALLPDCAAFRRRFGVAPSSGAAVALLSALKASREAVVPVGDAVFVHTRSGGEKLRVRNDAAVKRIVGSASLADGVWYRRFRGGSVVAWGAVVAWVGLAVAAAVWAGSVREAFLDGVAVLQLGAVLGILALGVGREFRRWVGLLVGWRPWGSERDIVRDVGRAGRDALVGGLLSGGSVDRLVRGFGIGEGVQVGEWAYDPRFGFVVGEKNAFCVRGRRWFRVEKETVGGKGGATRYRLFATGVRKAFVGVAAGVSVIDGGEKEVV